MSHRGISTIQYFSYKDFGYSICTSSCGDVYKVGLLKYKDPAKNEAEHLSMTKLSSLSNIKSIACGMEHVACLDFDGNVFTFGYNDSGQLGLGKIRSKNIKFTLTPQKVDIPPSTKQVACGSHFTVCISERGNVCVFGGNFDGQLGLKFASYTSPIRLKPIENIDFVECGGDFVIYKTFENELYVVGANYHGQLGTGNRTHQRRPYKFSPISEDIVDIKCGAYHTLLLTANQEVYSSGEYYGRYIHDNENSSSFKKVNGLSEIVRIDCGSRHSMCIDIYNDLYVFGDNSYGQLGLGDNSNRRDPVKHPSLTNVIDISPRSNHSFVTTSSNKIYAFGNNTNFQLGIKSAECKFNPVRVLKGKEDIWCSNLNMRSKAKSARK